MTDRGAFADPEKKSLFAAASRVQHLTPAIGTELSGIDLRQLSSAQKDELCVFLASSCLCALLARSMADRGGFMAVRCWSLSAVSFVSVYLDRCQVSGWLVGTLTDSTVFRDQEISIQEQLELARHFGPLHKHATTPIPREAGLEEVHGAFAPPPPLPSARRHRCACED